MNTALRTVALKIIPEACASDPDRLARFQAQVLVSLSVTCAYRKSRPRPVH